LSEAEPTIILKDVVLDFPFHNAGRTTFRKQLLSIFKKENRNWFRAVNGVNMIVKRGEVIGLIGSNGAGKSTLMRMIAGIYKPDRGSVVTKGRVTLLASLGLGFSNDLPGRDNIYLVGGLLGLRAEELASIENDIIDFSGLGKFIDAPIRTYSAGMRARLGFAIACHTNPDILLLDEVFSVGDYDFRRRSRAKIQEMVEGDTTVVITSHNIGTLKQMCDRLFYVESGKILVTDDNALAIKLYEME
jgi:ABC-2 type transport system ATP-binding protein/lipopolysaccharide transport system ATP-binding protein